MDGQLGCMCTLGKATTKEIIMPGRATGKTTRAVLKTALRMSRGEHLVVFASDFGVTQTSDFMRRVRYLVNMMDFTGPDTNKYCISAAGGGNLRMFIQEAHAQGYKYDRIVRSI